MSPFTRGKAAPAAACGLRWLGALLLAAALRAGTGPPPELYDQTRPAVRAWSIEDGLPNSSVHALMLDNKGRIWAGTQEGAAMWGGLGWTPVAFPPTVSSIFIRGIAETSDGSLWFATQDDGIWRLDGKDWIHYRGGAELPVSRVNCLLLSRDGSLWAGTWGGGALHFVDGRWVPLPAPGGKDAALVWKLHETVGPDRVRRIWVASQQGLASFARGVWSSSGLPPGSVNELLEAPEPNGTQGLWASCWGRGLAHWNGSAWTFYGPAQGFPSLNPTTLARDAEGDGTLWAGTYDRGLWAFRHGVWKPVPLGSGSIEGSTQEVTGIYSLLANPWGRPRLWVGSRGNGLLALDDTGWRRLDTGLGLPSVFASCFLELRDGGREEFWIGGDKGLSRWSEGKLKVFTRAEGLPGDLINDIAATPEGRGHRLWAATLNGLASFDGARWKTLGAADGIPWQQAECLCASQDAEGAPVLWAGFEGGLARWSHGRWEAIGAAQGLPSPSVYCLLATQASDGQEELWVGFRGGGAARWKGGRWTSFGLESHLPNLSVYSLKESRSGDGRHWLWAGTLGGGLARLDLDRSERGWQVYDTRKRQDLPSNIVRRIELDRRGRLYLATPRGVVRLNLDPRTHEPQAAITYSQGDGLPATSTNFNASYLDPEGRLWVGTPRGIGILDTELQEPPTRRPPAPLLERMLADEQDLRGAERKQVDYRARSLSFEFDLPIYYRREDLRYQTQLLGMEAEPSEWRREGRRDFTALPHGSYVLRVWAQDASGALIGPLDVPFAVQTPPWLRWWAYLLYLAAGLGLLAAIVRTRTRILSERARALKALVAERTQALEEANAALLNQSHTDPLTRLNNRRFVDSAMPDVIARILRSYRISQRENGAAHLSGRDLVFLMVDLDHFKDINDHHGHHAGDLVLQQTAAILKEAVREGDWVVRWGGEEFLVVAQESSVVEAPVVAERVRSLIEAHAFEAGTREPLRLSCSLGFASFPVIAWDPAAIHWEQVVDLADQCLYQAKSAGRNRWVGIVPREDAQPDLSVGDGPVSLTDLVDRDLISQLESHSSEPSAVSPQSSAKTAPTPGS